MSQLLTRRAQIGPSTLNLRERTAEAIVATGEPLRRHAPSPSGDDTAWIEVLDIGSCELPPGSPVLRGHNFNDPEALIGTVVSSRIEDGKLIAMLRFSSRPEIDRVLQDLSQNIGVGVSIGYEVLQ